MRRIKITMADKGDLIGKMIDKSQEAFIVGIELYNKPTIRYRVEGFSFFICNAWELLLKAYFLKLGKEIYYRDNPNRTITLEMCLRQIYTNAKDPLRKNLEQIIELRNTSTHFITEEYEQIYVPLFQASVLNYINKLLDYFSVDITTKPGSNFLTLSVKLSDLDTEQIKARYPKEIAERLIGTMAKIGRMAAATNHIKYAIPVRHDFYITKDQKKATAVFSFTKNADQAAYILKERHDMQQLCPYPQKRCLELINTRLCKAKIPFVNPYARDESKRHRFNTYCFGLFEKFYSLKKDATYCYEYNRNANSSYSYSMKAIDLIFEQIQKDPEHVIQDLRTRLEHKKRSQPQGQRNSKP